MHSAEGLNTLIHSPEVTELLRSVNTTAQVAERSLTRLDAEIAPEVRVQLNAEATALLRDSQQLVRRVDAQVVPMSDGVQKTLDAVRTTLKDRSAHPPCRFAGDADGGQPDGDLDAAAGDDRAPAAGGGRGCGPGAAGYE